MPFAGLTAAKLRQKREKAKGFCCKYHEKCINPENNTEKSPSLGEGLGWASWVVVGLFRLQLWLSAYSVGVCPKWALKAVAKCAWSA